MDAEMAGVLDRTGELIKELEREYDVHVKEDIITERARNLFHEALVKMRSALDMCMCRIWERCVPDSLSDKERRYAERSRGFPICDDHAGFDRKLASMKLESIEHSYPEIYSLLIQPQPFKTGKDDLKLLRDMANLGKHVRLVKQSRSARMASRAKLSSGWTVAVVPAVESEAEAIERMGKNVDRATIEKFVWVDIAIEGYDVHPYWLLKSQYTSLRRYVPKLLDALEKSVRVGSGKTSNAESKMSIAGSQYEFLVNEAIWARICWHNLQSMASLSIDDRAALSDMADTFFHLVEHCLLQDIVLILRRAADKSLTGNATNVTIKGMVDAHTELETDSLAHPFDSETARRQCSRFINCTSKLKGARDHVFAHNASHLVLGQEKRPAVHNSHVDASIRALCDCLDTVAMARQGHAIDWEVDEEGHLDGLVKFVRQHLASPEKPG